MRIFQPLHASCFYHKSLIQRASLLTRNAEPFALFWCQRTPVGAWRSLRSGPARKGARVVSGSLSKSNSLYPSGKKLLDTWQTRLPAAQSTVSPGLQQNPQQGLAPRAGGGVMQSVVDGLTHGIGWAFGMRAVDALFGARQLDVVHHNEPGGDVSGGSQYGATQGTQGLSEGSAGGEHSGGDQLGPSSDQWQWGSSDSEFSPEPEGEWGNDGGDGFDLEF